MERHLGLHLRTLGCALATISKVGARPKASPVETDGRVLIEAIRVIPGTALAGPLSRPRTRKHDSYSKNGTMSSATTFKILIIGLTAGPAVSL
jgi:hypothetical protein